MYKYFLTEGDMIENSHFPAIALFNEASNRDIVEFFTNLSNGVGGGYNYVSCYFWGNLDEFDQSGMNPFEGLCVETEDNERVILSYQHVIRYMKLITTRYSKIRNNCALSEVLNGLTDEFSKKFL